MYRHSDVTMHKIDETTSKKNEFLRDLEDEETKVNFWWQSIGLFGFRYDLPS